MKVFILFAIACSIPALEAIKCYSCNTSKDKSCEYANDKHVRDCPGQSCVVSQFKEHDKTVTFRECTPKLDDICKDEGATGRYCICNKDKCNNANIVTSSGFSLLALLLVIAHNCFYS